MTADTFDVGGLLWRADTLLEGYEAASWIIPGAELADGETGDEQLTATLVRRNEPKTKRAVIYLHGWSDYFFQTHEADFWHEQGYDFYALELRRYGRNLRPGLFAGYVSDLHDYFVELDQAWQIVAAEGYEQILLMGHSTGGLTASLWASQTSYPLAGLVLNSPWLDMHASAALWKAVSPIVRSIATINPLTALTFSDPGHYRRSISASEGGEWDVNPAYKSNAGFQVRFGWGRAILEGHTRVALGLDIRVPVLAMMSERSMLPGKEWNDDYASADIVLDSDKLARAALNLGPVVTIARIDGALHDIFLSAKPVRDAAFDQLSRWLRGYLD